MKFIYHYHAIWFPYVGQQAHADGLATLGDPISTPDQYMAFKQALAKEVGMDAEKITICSLSQLCAQRSRCGNCAEGLRLITDVPAVATSGLV